jgi:diguanylate cyclase (GGDEF)-like protein
MLKLPMRYYVLFFILYEIVISLFFYKLYLNNVGFYHQRVSALTQNNFRSAINTYEMSNNNFHAHYADELSRIVEKANGASKLQRDALRQELLDSFYSFYNDNKLMSLDVFHIFDAEGRSLLRFHRPDKYDDPIYKKRFSIENIRRTFSYQQGFEIGVYRESWRFQYPLFYDGHFVGSYEYGISFQALMREMEKFYGNHYILLLNQAQVDAVSTPEVIKKRYHQTVIGSENYYLLRSNCNDVINREHLKHFQNNATLQDALKMKEKDVVEYFHASEFHSVAIMPLFDIAHTHIGYLLTDVQEAPVMGFVQTLIIQILLATLFSIGLYLFIIRQIQHKIYVRNLINLQHDILIVTDGQLIKDANDAMLKFFGYKDLKSFQNEHSCICNFFVNENGYLTKEKGHLSWIAYMQKHPDIKHRVKILNLDKTHTIFELQLEPFEESLDMVITFRDVTLELDAQHELEDRANFDALTHIYNRSRFEFFLNKELERSARYGELFSLIMFDIDHFKEVNDTYGHDIGDDILVEVTSLVSHHTRDVDIFARWGGEEFMIISHTEILQSEAFSEKLRNIISTHAFDHVNRLTCSFGLTQYRKNDTLETITKRVDEMLYTAKNSGRNCVVSVR